MGRTWLSVITALALVAASLALHLVRRWSPGGDWEGPRGAAAWKVTVAAAGDLGSDEATLTTARPPDFRHQHIFDEQFQSQELIPPHGKKSHSRDIVWRRASMRGTEPFRLTYSFRCVLGMQRPTSAMVRLTHDLDGAPQGGADLRPTPRIESGHRDIVDKAAELVRDGMTTEEQAEALFEFVDHLEDEPPLGSRTALECLRDGRGDSAGKSRLLVALCRSRGIPARVVSGLALAGDQEQGLHRWAEAWINAHWLPMCPTHHAFSARKFPKNYLVLRVGDEDLVRGRGARLHFGFVTRELHDATAPDDGEPSAYQLFWQKLSLSSLWPGEQRVVQFLLLLPLAALIVSVFRTLIGVPTFGTFSPALIGLAFLDLKALPWGLSIFVLTVLVGWALRRLLDRYHLLLVPRTSVLLTLIVCFLMGVILVANHFGVSTTQYISLFPLVILTHLVERFWTVESEDGTAASFKTLLGTLVVAVTISVLLSPEVVTRWMFRYPETLGGVLALQLLLGRYTGYRLSELYRFRDLLEDPPTSGGAA